MHLNTARGYLELDPIRFRMPDLEGLVEWLDDDLTRMGDDWICYVAVDDDHIVGQIEARVVQPMDTSRYQVVRSLGSVRGYVNSLGVLASHRRRGVGRVLMDHAERWLADRGATVIELDTLASSPESVPFYKAIGYEPRSIIFERQL